jgi:hypothetical protein
MFPLSLLALAAPALATIYTISPVTSTVSTGGQALHVQWTDDGATPSLSEIGAASINLCVGSQTNQTCVQELGASVDVSKATYVNATIDPSVGENGDFYFIRYTSIAFRDGAYPYQQFSARFT